MSRPAAEELDSALRAALARHPGVPGASAALHRDGATAEAAVGTANLRSGVAVTPATLFQIASVTKLLTAALVVDLLEETGTPLDAPVAELAPEYHGPREVTVRRVLDHTSGLEGDFLALEGWGDDALERFARALAEIPLLHPPGSRFSYSNAAYLLAGRVAEALGGGRFRPLVRERLLGPWGLGETALGAEEAILHPVAIGHHPGADGRSTPTGTWYLPRYVDPSGEACATARDVVRLGRRCAGRWRGPTVPVPAPAGGDAIAYGAGWCAYRSAGGTLLGHDGAVMGQHAALRVSEDGETAAAVLANGPGGASLCREVVDELLGTPAAQAPWRPLDASEPGPWLGRYGRLHAELEVALRGERPVASLRYDGWLLHDELEVVDAPLHAVGADGIGFVDAVGERYVGVLDGDGAWLHLGERAFRRLP